MDKLVKIVDYLWETKSVYKELTPERELQEVKKALKNSTFQFSSMYRSWIPKPNKPGKLRPITQPKKKGGYHRDGCALSHLLNLIFEEIFLPQSHGFRKGRGPITFFLEIQSWGPVDRLIKSDVVKCFDNIDHGLLISVLRSYLGEGNPSFCDLISAFLQTPILDKKRNDHSNHTKGIPQGSPLSPVLMNIFLHQLDMKINYFMQTEESIGYVRYADDMIFAIKSGVDSEGGLGSSFALKDR